MLIRIFWIIFTTICLLFCLLINISYFTDLEVYQVLIHFFIRPSKVLIRQCLFEGFQRQHVLVMYLFFTKITIDVYLLSLISVCRTRAGQFFACYAYLLASDWCSMTDVVYMCQLILLYVRIKIIVVVTSVFEFRSPQMFLICSFKFYCYTPFTFTLNNSWYYTVLRHRGAIISSVIFLRWNN